MPLIMAAVPVGIPPFIHSLTYVYAVLALVGVPWLTWKLYRGFRNGFPFEAMLWVLIWIYLVGVCIKIFVIGPQWLRFHLSDFGFPAFVSFVVYTMFQRDIPDEESRLAFRRRTAYIAFALSTLYECFVGLLYWSHSVETAQIVGGFDPVDILAYGLGSAAALLIVHRWQIAYRPIADADRQRQAADEREALVWQRRLRRSRRPGGPEIEPVRPPTKRRRTRRNKRRR